MTYLQLRYWSPEFGCTVVRFSAQDETRQERSVTVPIPRRGWGEVRKTAIDTLRGFVGEAA